MAQSPCGHGCGRRGRAWPRTAGAPVHQRVPPRPRLGRALAESHGRCRAWKEPVVFSKVKQKVFPADLPKSQVL